MHSISKETLVEEDLVHVESLKIGFMVLCIRVVGGYHNIQHMVLVPRVLYGTLLN